MRIRTICFSFLILLPLISAAGAQEAQRPQPTFSISISVPQNVLNVGSPIPLKIVVKNISDHDIPWGAPAGMRGEDLKVWDQDNKLVRETEHGQKVHGRHRETVLTTVFSYPLKKGDSLEYQCDLAKEFDLSKPGKYTVQAERREHDEVFVKSNKVTFTVTP